MDGRVALVTGGGRGVGREHALALARAGARVVVNDMGSAGDGAGADAGPAAEVAAEIRALGGEAVSDTSDVTSWGAGAAMIRTAVEAFGDLHVLVTNAGILRDRMFTGMSEEEFDSVLAVHVKGTATIARHAAGFWRDQAKAGDAGDRSIITTTSHAGLAGNVGQVNYSGAKAAIAAMTQTMAMELARYGVRANSIAPIARTRLTLSVPNPQLFDPPADPAEFDRWDPANISPLVVYLASADCPLTGQVLGIHGGTICRYSPWSVAEVLEHDGQWTVDALSEALGSAEPIASRTQMDVVRRQIAG